ncbi:MAG: dihydropteroate synthase [Bacteroidaceae bacterium]|nr:dihydropteroate synthase [Bacteroidaceae bacterium]
MTLSNFITDNLSGECLVMGILNCTPDSFFSGSRKQTEEEVRQRALEIVAEGGDMIDVGACSTRPGCVFASEAEEMERLRFALPIIKEAVPDVPLSVDTFRASVARMCVKEFGDMIINDVSEGEDPDMFPAVAELGVPYILMSVKPNIREMALGFAEKVQQLRDLGAKDIILDPGFGFGKTLQQNFEVMNDIDFLREFNLPILVGVSRKSMIFKTLGITPNESLNGTTVLNTIALMKGAADILRVHDVKAAKEAVRLVESLHN